ncbi:MAG: putative inorganic carbon transporter subunit DabA, partial [Pseudomonadota bacterium]
AVRLSVMIEAPVDAITEILRKHHGVRQLFDNGWLHLFALQDGRISARYRQDLKWEASSPIAALAA